MNVMKLLDLTGKVALVTGGAGNYGSQMTEALAEAGATVITASRSLEKNKEFAAALQAKGLKVYGESYDQASQESILDLAKRLEKDYGGVEILVNNSVLRCSKGYYSDPELFQKSFSVNATGLILMCRVFGDAMAEKGKGSIINIGSYMGDLGCNEALYEGCPHISSVGAVDYFYHKGGMHNLTRFLASRLGPKGVRVNCLSLGGLFNNQPEPFLEAYSKATFLGRLAKDDDVKGAVVYLASDASAYMTGAVIPLDGGYSAK